MARIRTTIAAMLAALAFVAFQSDADAQARRSESRSTGNSQRAASVTRTTPKDTRSSDKSISRQTPQNSKALSKPSGSSVSRRVDRDERKPSTTVTRPSTARKPVARPDNKVSQRPSRKVEQRPGNQVQRPDVRPSQRPERPGQRPDVKPDRRPDHRPDRPVQVRPDRRPDVRKVHPRDRDFMPYDRPAHFWTGHNHCYGHRVRVLPSHVRRHVHYGITYYCYNDIWYRPYGGYYVVCRPPFGTILAAELIADMTWAAVRLSYYYTVANTYSQINENNEYIAQQNEMIARNNAVIASQNQTIAMNGQLASQAYTLANELGLVQSYADAGSNYFYQDGVFYTKDQKGEYKVIVPPAGALVESLPEDYDMVTLDGDEYYQVDDTVYKVTISEGKPYFEVLGQLYS